MSIGADRRRRRRSTRCCAGCPGVLALAGHVDVVGGDHCSPRPARRGDVGHRASPRRNADELDADALERANAELIDLKDALWAIRHDRLRTAREVEALAGRDAPAIGARRVPRRATGLLRDRPARSARPRLGRSPRVRVGPRHRARCAGHARRRARHRPAVPVRRRRATPASASSFVYKAAAEIGELGDNTAALRRALSADALLRRALQSPGARVAHPRPHPLGERRHHQRAEHPPAQLVRTRTARWRCSRRTSWPR